MDEMLPWCSARRPIYSQPARRNIDAFLAGEYEAIIVNAAGCGAP
jgi:hypothetical protein